MRSDLERLYVLSSQQSVNAQAEEWDTEAISSKFISFFPKR